MHLVQPGYGLFIEAFGAIEGESRLPPVMRPPVYPHAHFMELGTATRRGQGLPVDKLRRWPLICREVLYGEFAE